MLSPLSIRYEHAYLVGIRTWEAKLALLGWAFGRRAVDSCCWATWIDMRIDARGGNKLTANGAFHCWPLTLATTVTPNAIVSGRIPLFMVNVGFVREGEARLLYSPVRANFVFHSTAAAVRMKPAWYLVGKTSLGWSIQLLGHKSTMLQDQVLLSCINSNWIPIQQT